MIFFKMNKQKFGIEDEKYKYEFGTNREIVYLMKVKSYFQ